MRVKVKTLTVLCCYMTWRKGVGLDSATDYMETCKGVDLDSRSRAGKAAQDATGKDRGRGTAVADAAVGFIGLLGLWWGWWFCFGCCWRWGRIGW